MPDWTGSRARADALAVPCAYCHAFAGQPCVNLRVPDHPPLRHFAAHQKRINDAAILEGEVPF